MSVEVKGLIVEIFKIRENEYNLGLTMDDVPNWDSLKHMELITRVESDYDIVLDLEEIVSMRSVNSIIETLKGKGVSID